MAQRRLKQNFNEVQAILDAVGQKVDKIEGKGLSANDYTDEDKDKLASVEEDAQENVIEVIESDGVELPIENKTVRIPAHKQSDWSQNDSSGKDYIKNRTHWEENGVVHKLHPKFLDMDASPTSGSTKPVMSGGVKEALDGKQDVISDLADIRQGAGLGETAYQKPSAGIPASDLAAGVIPDVSGFITRTVNDLANYYLKSETYTKEEVAALISAIRQFHYEVYAALPATGEGNVLYLIGPTGSGSDKYEEYVYANNGWVKIGDTSIDLSGYVTIEALNQALSGYVTSAALATALTGKVGSETIHNIVELTQAEYDALQTKRDDTMYITTNTTKVYIGSRLIKENVKANEEDIDFDSSDKLQFADRVYNTSTPDGLGYVILRKNKTFAQQVTATNTIYEIRYDFDLGETTVTIPSGCILRFDGGCINNGVLSGNNTSIIGGDYKIFNGVTFAGTWKGDINACWIGVRQNDSTFDNSPILQAWFDNYCEYFPGIVFPCSVYYFSSAVVLSSDKRNKHIYGDGSVFNVNIPTDDSVFITLNVGEAFSLRDIKFQNVRTTGAYNISKTTALHLVQTHQFGIQGVEIRNFDKGVWLTDVWYGNFYGKNSFWQNRIALFLDVTSSQEVNTIDLHNIRVTGCVLDAAKALYPQESGESEDDWAMRYARCGVDVHCTTYGVKYSGMVIEGVDYGVRYNYRPRSTQAAIDALIIIENCYFEGNTHNDIYIGKGYVINPNNLANYYVISGGHVKIDSCLFHSTLDPHIFIKDCYTLITNCSPVKFVQDYQYGRSMVDAGEEVSANMAAANSMTIKRGSTLSFPSASGNVFQTTLRQTIGNIRNRDMASGLLNGSGALRLDSDIYVVNGSGVARYIPAVQGMTDSPRVNVHFGIQPYEMDIMDNIYHVRISSGNGSVRVACYGSQYTTCVYSFRNDGIEITEFLRRWKAGIAYEGYVNQVFPFRVRSVPADGKLYMENYQGVESLIGVGKKAIDDGFSLSTGYYMFVDALCYIFFAYSVPRFVSDLVQCGRSYTELGISGSSTAQYNKFRFICTDAQRANLRPRLNAVIYNTTSKKLQIYDGTQWVELTDPFKRYVYAESGASIFARATAPDLPGQTYFNYATGITYRYALTSVDKYNGEWIGDIGQVSALDHPNGYDATSNPLDYVTELTAGEMVRCNGALYKWDGTQFVAL